MKILVFGETGQVAREIIRQAPNLGHEVELLGRDKADLSRPEECQDPVLRTNAQCVINAAAYTAVDRAESEPDTAQRINAAAPGAMARACCARALPFLHISTDYVFDGSGNRPWLETDVVAPVNTYGASKLAGEIAVTASNAQAIILRTSWVFSAHGSNFVRTMLQLGHERSELKVVNNQIGGPTPASAIAQTLLDLAERMIANPSKRGIYHYSGAPEVSWQEFAIEIFRRAGLNVNVTGIPTAEYPTPARRPLNSRLDCSRLLADFGIARPDWKAALTAVLDELGELA